MKRTILILALLSVSSAVVMAQAGHAGQEKNLRGLKGVLTQLPHDADDDVEQSLDRSGGGVFLKMNAAMEVE